MLKTEQNFFWTRKRPLKKKNSKEIFSIQQFEKALKAEKLSQRISEAEICKINT